MAEHRGEGTDSDVEAPAGTAGLAIWRRGGPRLAAKSEDVNNTQTGGDWRMKIDEASRRLNRVDPRILVTAKVGWSALR